MTIFLREKPVRQHLKQVYGCLAVAMITAAVGSYVYLAVYQVSVTVYSGSSRVLFQGVYSCMVNQSKSVKGTLENYFCNVLLELFKTYFIHILSEKLWSV